MVDFSHVRKGSPTLKTARYTFYDIQGEPWIEVARADESNQPYFNQLLRTQARGRRAMRANINTGTLKRNRAEDRRLFPEFIGQRWGNVTDASGMPVPYDKEACRQFLEALPDEMFDDLRDFAANPYSFVEQLPGDEDDDGGDVRTAQEVAEEVGKN